MNLTATDLTRIVEALHVAAGHLRHADGPGIDGPCYHRALDMGNLERRVQATLDALTVEVEVQ